MNQAPAHFSARARRLGDPPISWLMKVALERPGLISLAVGFTDSETLPVAEVRDVTHDILRHPVSAQAALQYGTTSGLPTLREEIFRHWRKQDGVSKTRLDADDVIVTNGSQQLLHLITEALCDPGDLVLVEDPTYFVYLGIIEALGTPALGFTGLAGLKQRLEELKKRKLLQRLKLLYLVTYFQNPTGATWTLEEKREALAMVQHYERVAGHPIYILEDAAYRDLRFAGPDVPSFQVLDPLQKRVAYTNTLTKPFATGIKLGYGLLPPPLMQAVLRSKGNQDFGSSNFLQTILARALSNGLYEKHLPVMAAAYRRKHATMLRALRTHFPATARYQSVQGGLYIWVELPRRIRTGVNSRFFRRALDMGVLYVPGEMCYAKDSSRTVPSNYLRLSFGAPSDKQIVTGVKLLAEALGAMG